MTVSNNKGNGVPVLLSFSRFQGMFVGFLNEYGEERWLKDTSIVGGMAEVRFCNDGAAPPTVCLTVRETVFKRRRIELQEFVCPAS